MTTLEIILLSILAYFILSFFLSTVLEKNITGKEILEKFIALIICPPIILFCILVWPFDELSSHARRKRLKKKIEVE